MSDAIEVLKKYSTYCSVCKYDDGNQCKASGGEFGECKPAEELNKAIDKALLALEKQEKLKEWLDDKEAKLKDIKNKGWSLEQLAGKQILINEIRKELEEDSAKTKGFLESPRKKLGDVEK